MTALEQATATLLSAIEHQEFEDLPRVLEERGRLLAAGAEVTPRAAELGEAACRALVSLKQKLVLESSRLDQIRIVGETLSANSPARLVYFG